MTLYFTKGTLHVLIIICWTGYTENPRPLQCMPNRTGRNFMGYRPACQYYCVKRISASWRILIRIAEELDLYRSSFTIVHKKCQQNSYIPGVVTCLDTSGQVYSHPISSRCECTWSNYVQIRKTDLATIGVPGRRKWRYKRLVMRIWVSLYLNVVSFLWG